ncbi:hypothetical protein EVAR_2966_1 [Eumeta japonica]|uniref:Mos1 transposase HTH domain-containing protein n=1 Tax=Eumeta variegata TaxID=151549 RepID=A0A4C1SWM4_EUMVA|nr:hypothetical protein EVAR_2966_1 [Eumeta japonica]
MTIYNCFAEFKRGRVNLNDEFRDGRPFTAENKTIDAVRRMIETDRHKRWYNRICLFEHRFSCLAGNDPLHSERNAEFGPERREKKNTFKGSAELLAGELQHFSRSPERR